MRSVFELPVSEDFVYTFSLFAPDGSVRSGLAGLTCYVSDSDGGSVIAGMPVAAATETATPGTYKATFPRADLQGSLLARVGRAAYLSVAQGVAILGSDACVIRAAPRTG